MRLIDADALISEIKKDTEKAIEQDDIVGSFWLGYIAGLVIKQPTAQPSTSDLISRQAAIDALIGISGSKSIEELTEECEVYQSDNRCYSGGVYGAIRAIKTLPTIQPQSTVGQLNDGARSTAQSTNLIDRQEAIDALDCINGTEEVLRSLPPAQPEPHEGYWIGSDGSYICSECNGSPLDFINTMGASFDAYVETPMNFCPNCGAKMTISTK